MTSAAARRGARPPGESRSRGADSAGIDRRHRGWYSRDMPIHPTAIVSPKAEVDSSVEVGAHAIIEEHVKIGAGTRIWANAHLTGHTEIGRDNEIHMGAVIGHEPQDVKFDRTCRSYLKIG